MTHQEKAKEYFQEGYNCAQAVLLAFCQDFDLDPETALRLSSSFGGGMGRLREVCGAVSGMFMVAGLAVGYSDPNATDEKKDHYATIQGLAKKFQEENGSILCRDLLGLTKLGGDTPIPEARTREYYQKRPCVELVGNAASLIAQELGLE